MDDTDRAQFDAYSNDYSDHVDNSVKFSGQTTEFFHQVKVDVLMGIVARYQQPAQASAVDVGCGTGSLAELIAPRVADLAGVDLSAESIEQARKRLPDCEFKAYPGDRLPFADDSADLVFTSCVMHHVPPDDWLSFATEMVRVTRPGGLVAVVEHNPWNPLTRVAVSRCEFDEDAVLLTAGRTKKLLQAAGTEIVEQPYILFFPWKSKLCRGVERGLRWLPLGAQYIVVGRKPDA